MLCKDCATDQTARAHSTNTIFLIVDQLCQMAQDADALKVSKKLILASWH
jgi:hypothetical protein